MDSGKLLDRQFQRADRLSRENLLKPSENSKEDNKRVPHVLT